MIETLLQMAWVIALLPFLSAFFIVTFGRRSGQLSAILAIAGTGLAGLLSILTFWGFATNDRANEIAHGSLRWLTSGSFDWSILWRVDPLTALMLPTICLVSLLVQIYSVGYMANDKGLPRYFALLAFFTSAMLALVLSYDFVSLYIAWELVGVCSYLLVGFWFQKPEAVAAAKKAFIVTRFGDLGLLIAIMIIYQQVGTLSFDALELALAGDKIPQNILGAIALLTFCGAVGKSAQFPLHVWLPDAMEGPTPVSALIHAATMVAAGVYLVARLFDLFLSAPEWVLNLVATTGAITALMAATIATVQFDIKRVLAYSTVSQLGLMVMALGLGTAGYVAAIFHLFNHAFFKALLFLCAGNAIHATHEQDMRHMGGLRKMMPWTATFSLIGVASLSGLPLITSGFWSKDELLLAAWNNQPILFYVAALTSVLTAFYMFRFYFLVFTGTYRGETADDQNRRITIHEAPLHMLWPLALLALFSIASGWLNTPWWHGFSHWLDPHQTLASPEENHFFLMLIISTCIFLSGLGLAWWRVGRRPLETPVAGLRQLLEQGYYFDVFYRKIVQSFLGAIARWVMICERRVVDGLGNLTALGVLGTAEALKFVQTGAIQAYLFLAITAMIILSVLARLFMS